MPFRMLVLLPFALAFTLARPSAAITLELAPADSIVEPSDVVMLALVVSDLGSDVLGDYDVDVSFDPSLLTLTSFTPTTVLGDFGLEALDFSLGEGPPGLLNLAVVSLLPEATLDALQAPPFVLASIELTVGAIAPGVATPVMLAVNAVGNGDGDPLPVDALGHATLRRLPEPGTGPLLLVGVAASLVLRRRY